MVVLAGPGSPYITPEILKRAPTGISWATIPNKNSDAQEQRAEQMNICLRATGMVDTACNQVVRCTQNIEQLTGPDWRVTVQRSTGVGRIMLGRWPVLQVLGGRVAATGQFPRQWTSIAANQYDIERPVIGLYNDPAPADAGEGGQAVLVAPGFLHWMNGRNGLTIQTTYINGWPHTGLTADIAAGASTIQVDECAGWAPVAPSTTGVTGVVLDGQYQETAQVQSASVAAGPGTLTLAAPLLYPHSAGTLFTSLPQQLMNAAIDFSTSMALERGATSTVVMAMSTTGNTSRANASLSPINIRDWATAACKPFARVI